MTGETPSGNVQWAVGYPRSGLEIVGLLSRFIIKRGRTIA